MIVAIQHRRPGLVGDLLETLAITAAKIGYDVTRDVASVISNQDAVFLVWNGHNHRAPGARRV